MPLIYVNSPAGAFSDSARDHLADELTVIALESEKLPMPPFDKSATWIYFHELPWAQVYHGGNPGGPRSSLSRSTPSTADGPSREARSSI